MSIFQAQLSGLVPILSHVTSNAVVSIADATDAAIFVAWFQVNENAGATPNLSVSITDGTTTEYLGNTAGTLSTWKAKALTAGQSVLFDAGYIVPLGWKLQVLSSDAAGKMDVVGVRTSGR